MIWWIQYLYHRNFFQTWIRTVNIPNVNRKYVSYYFKNSIYNLFDHSVIYLFLHINNCGILNIDFIDVTNWIYLFEHWHQLDAVDEFESYFWSNYLWSKYWINHITRYYNRYIYFKFINESYFTSLLSYISHIKGNSSYNNIYLSFSHTIRTLCSFPCSHLQCLFTNQYFVDGLEPDGGAGQCPRLFLWSNIL